MYASVWLALGAFVLGEAARGRTPSSGSPRAAFGFHAFGLTLMVTHVLIAMGWVHGWSHDAATAATARQSAAAYGLAWGGGVWVNYAFVAMWTTDVWRLGRDARRGRVSPPLPAPVEFPRRAFYVVMFVNAAVVFAGGLRPGIGIALVVAVLWTWRPRIRTGSR
jgi:hypothetical protein